MATDRQQHVSLVEYMDSISSKNKWWPAYGCTGTIASYWGKEVNACVKSCK